MYTFTSYKSFPSHLSVQIFFCAFLPMLLGFCIYLLFRSEHILINRWVIQLSEAWHFSDDFYHLKASLSDYKLPSWVRYNLPDALWLFACVYSMLLLWHRQSGVFMMVVTPLLMALLHESAQFFGYIGGTFDWKDVRCYLISYLITLAVHYFF